MITDSAAGQHSGPGATAEPPGKWPLRRTAGLLVGLLVVVISVGMVCAGVFAALASSGGTYVGLGAHGSYRTARYALATDSTNWRTAWFGWAGSVRIKVVSDDEKPIFVGVAAPDAISRYLSGTGYTTVAEHTGRGVVRTDHDGAVPAMPPASAVTWTAHSEGTGTLTLRWDATAGPQIAFAMNADGSRPVSVRIVSSAITLDRMPWWVPACSLGLALILLPAGIVMLRRTIRARRAEA